MNREPEFTKRVGLRIKALRVEHKLSQNALARMLRHTATASQISRWERGESFPNLANLKALACAFEISEEDVICGQQRRRPGRVSVQRSGEGEHDVDQHQEHD